MREGSDIIFPDRVGNFFIYTSWKLGSSLLCKLPIYNICYLHMCVGQRGGDHGRITEYAGHIIHQSTWHTVFGGERWKIWQKLRYSSVLQYKPRFSCARQTLPVWKHNGRSCSCSRLRCEMGITFIPWSAIFAVVLACFFTIPAELLMVRLVAGLEHGWVYMQMLGHNY